MRNTVLESVTLEVVEGPASSIEANRSYPAATPMLFDRIDFSDEESRSPSLDDLNSERLQSDAELPADVAHFNKDASGRIDTPLGISSFIPNHGDESNSVRNTGLHINKSWASEWVAREFRVVTQDTSRLLARLCPTTA